MKTKLRPIVITIAKQMAIAAALITAVGFWQTSSMPRGLAPVVQVTAVDGVTFDVPSTDSPKLTLIYFFAPWCGVCRVSIKNLDAVSKWLLDVDVYAVALDYESKNDVLKFVQEVGVTAPVAFGSPEVRNTWNISGYPSYVIIGRDRQIRTASIGYSSQAGMLARLAWAKLW